MRGRKIAFDYGDTRIGVAVCDPDGILASPLPFIHNGAMRDRELLGLLDEYSPIEIIVGLPLKLSGESGQAIAKVEEFCKELTKLSDLPIIKVDERLSTVGAAKALRDAGKSAKESRTLIDSMAAVAILESYLATR